MKIETKYQQGLLKLIKEISLDEINVVNLCAAVKSNRQTFYYHFRDISDVVESILLKEKVLLNTKHKDIEAVCKAIVAYTNSHYSFLSNINKSFCADKVESFYYSYFYASITNLVGEEKKRTYSTILRYLCGLYSSEMTYWISAKRREKAEMLIRRFKVIWNYFINQYHGDLRRI